MSRFFFLAVLLAPGVALAQTEPDEQTAPPAEEQAAAAPGESAADAEARIHFDAGQSYYDRGRFEQALTEFEAAYELSPRALLLYNLFLTHERLAHLEDAARYLERYLAQDAPENREALEQRLATLREQIAAAEAEPEPESPAPAPAPAPSSGGGGIGLPAIVAFIVGGVGLATFGAMAILSEVEDGNLGAGCGKTLACTSDELSTLRTFNTVADIGLGVGAAGVVAGVILWLAGVGTGEAEVAASAAVVPGGGGAVVRGRF